VCGIAGIATTLGRLADDPATVASMLHSLAHRGPDDQHQVDDECAVIGARRLAIIDLDTGRQPVMNEDASVVVVQNGEIYNYVELRDELVQRGHVMRTSGDTEVIVHLYEEMGPQFVKRLRGMFAIAVWDRAKRRLVLARDRLGKKPLYWRLDGDRLLFGSELKALLSCPSAERKVDDTSLALYLQYQYVPAPHTILTGINKLAPASLLVWDGEAPTVDRYWTPSYEPKSTESEDDDRERCVSLLRTSVRLRMRSDVPVGVFLSGGMDSSVVTALMAEASSGPVRTFSIGFEDQAFDELPYARAVARHFGTDHQEEVVTLDAIGILPDLAVAYDEPFGDSSAVPTFRVAQLAAANLKVVLTGDGGDEAFGGYPRYLPGPPTRLRDGVQAPLRRLAATLCETALGRAATTPRFRRRLDAWSDRATMSSDYKYREAMTIFAAADRSRLLGRDVRATNDWLDGLMASGPVGNLDRMLWTDTLSYLPEDLLVKLDRATMAHSLEARSPLLDHELIEFAARLPEDRKVRSGESKWLLREVARKLMPAALVDRPKMGFGVPLAAWFRGALGDTFCEFVLAPDACSRQYLDVEVAAELLAEHVAGRRSHAYRLWSLLMFELWARTWLRDPPGSLS
jgi:asparagine synthase (glutamine-hydrolysing)